MVLQFTPPTDLVNAYLNRLSPGQQASEAVNQALQTYAKTKLEEHKQKNEALQTLLKASDSVDLSDPTTAKAFAPLYKSAGVDPSIFQPQTPSTGTTPSPAVQAPPVTAGVPDASGQAPTQAPQISPVIQASLNHPDHQPGFTPEYIQRMSRTGYGRRMIDSQEKGSKLLDSQASAAEKDALAKVPFSDVSTTFGAANEKAVGDQLIADAKAKGLEYVDSKKMDYALKGLGVKNTGLRGGALDSMAATREGMLRESLNKDARATLNPYFQSGPGKEQITRLNSIGRIEPLINQMLEQKGGGDPRQMREMATSFNKVLTGSGMGAEGQIDALMPNTARSQFAHWQEWWTNNPQGTEQQAFIKRVADSTGREKKAIQNQIRIQAESSAPTLRLLKEHYPQDYQAHLDSVMNNSSLVGETQPTTASPATGPHGPTVTQNGHTYTWNGTTYE